uniref:Uncharacterized protein n=1 Tax=Grateloupia filicina TaxID=31455 RepID=A0A2S1FXF6_9FLOR|nr:hypothetical protein Grafi_p105 [Grateloupia filicina]AWD77455.1 hypothetical protein Grafi_p105 [Grateloupia filicina]
MDNDIILENISMNGLQRISFITTLYCLKVHEDYHQKYSIFVFAGSKKVS